MTTIRGRRRGEKESRKRGDNKDGEEIRRGEGGEEKVRERRGERKARGRGENTNL